MSEESTTLECKQCDTNIAEAQPPKTVVVTESNAGARLGERRYLADDHSRDGDYLVLQRDGRPVAVYAPGRWAAVRDAGADVPDATVRALAVAKGALEAVARVSDPNVAVKLAMDALDEIRAGFDAIVAQEPHAVHGARADEFARVKVRLSALVASLDETVSRGVRTDSEFDQGAAHASAVTARQLREILNDTALGTTPHAAPELAMLRADLADAEAEFAKWPRCPAGCRCRAGTDDADALECGCDGPCTTGWEPKPAPELAAAMRESRVRAEVIAEILAAFGPSGSGHTARVGQVQIAKWRTRAGLTS